MSKGTLTADGSVAVSLPVTPFRNTPLSLYAEGTFGGGTLKVQISPDGDIANATDITGVSLTASGNKILPLLTGIYFVVLSGSTAPNIKWWLQ